MKNILIFVFIIGRYLLGHQLMGAEIQSHTAIYAVVNEFINKNLDPALEHEISLSNLDPRLQLEQCAQALEVFTPNQSIKPGRNSIGVRCNAGKIWSLYVAAQIKVFQNVVIATQPLKRGDFLSESVLNYQKLDIGLQKSGFITDINFVLGKQVLHALAANTPINNKDIAKATIIKRGDNVMITSSNPVLNIQMQGVAMMDATEGQNLRVKNTTSSRIINAIAVRPGVVTVDY